MKELVVISGKGGTGKTSIVGAFSALAENAVLCDADVDAADLHLLLRPDIVRRHDFRSGNKAVIDPDRCTQCGVCRDMCQWNAIGPNFVVDDISCEGCGVCVRFCPVQAVDFPEKTCGEWYVSETRFGALVHARLGIAEENSGKLVTLVRREARALAEGAHCDLIITDGPPGIGCPVIASIGGASAVLVVTEPSVSGRHDMERVIRLADHFNVPAFVAVNKYDLHRETADAIESFCREAGYPCLGRIPFDPAFTAAMVLGKSVIETDGETPGGNAVRELWENLSRRLDELPASA